MSKNVTETSAGKPFLERQALQKLISWKKAPRRNALCVVGPRQIGKTMLIRHFARQHYEHFVEINFATEPLAKAVFSGSLNAEAVITALSAYARRPLVPGETLIFLDEIQECPQARADIKFLVADGRFDYIESGFLLGAETKNGPSLPVGYETRLTMYPLDFAEFCTACGLQSVTFEYLKTCFETLQPVAESVHDSMLRLFYTYMVVGGMPQCVSTYLATHDIGQVLAVQNDILDRYRQDITRSGGRDMEKVLKTFEAIPFQLATKNRRFMLSEIAKTARLLRYENAFALLADAGVAMPCYNVTRPTTPLASNEKRNLFKLFLCDTGLLAAASLQNIQFDILQGNVGVNQGSILENLFAQQLHANGFALRYFQAKSLGEADFLIQDGKTIVPIAIRAGKNYKKHTPADKCPCRQQMGPEASHCLLPRQHRKRQRRNLPALVYGAFCCSPCRRLRCDAGCRLIGVTTRKEVVKQAGPSQWLIRRIGKTKVIGCFVSKNCRIFLKTHPSGYGALRIVE